MIRHNDIEIYNHLRLIRHGDKAVKFCNWRPDAQKRAVRFMLMKHLILGYHDFMQLFDLLYGELENGGPNQGPACIAVLLNQASHDIRKLGLELVWQKNGRRFRQYHLKPIEGSP